MRLTAGSCSVPGVLRESQYLLLLPLLLSINPAPLYYCTAALLSYLKRPRVSLSTARCGYRYVPVRVSVACVLSVLYAFPCMGVPVALGKAISSVLALRCYGLLRASSVQAWALAPAARHSLSSAWTVTQQGAICWSGQVQRDVFSRWPITQRCTISNAQHSSIFIGVCIPDICRNSVGDSSISPMHDINVALLLVAVCSASPPACMIPAQVLVSVEIKNPLQNTRLPNISTPYIHAPLTFSAGRGVDVEDGLFFPSCPPKRMQSSNRCR